MKKLIAVVALIAMLALAGCKQGQASSSAVVSSGNAVSASAPNSTVGSANAEAEKSTSAAADATASSAEAIESFIISANDKQLVVRLANTDAARALSEQLQAGPVTVSLHAYGGFEQVGPLPWGLPASDEQIVTSAGDVMLYQGNQITVFTSSNSWAYTPLGHIDGATSKSLHDTLGDGDVEVTLSLG